MRRERRWPIPFLDLSNTLFFFFVAMFAMTLMVISDADESKKADATSRYVIQMTWRDGSQNDIDLSLKTPTDDVVWFRSRQATFASLDNDNRGDAASTQAVDAAGNVITLKPREEIIYLRQAVQGTYTANVHFYAQHQFDGPPESITVSLIAIEPKWRKIIERHILMTERLQENTAFRFMVSPSGEITGTDLVEELFINRMMSK